MKLQFQKSRVKMMLIVFFDAKGVVHCEFVPEGQKVNAEFYVGVLGRLTYLLHGAESFLRN